MSDEPEVHEVHDVNVTADDDPTHGVTVSQPFITRIARPGVIFGLVMTGMLAMLSMTILVLYLAPSVDRLTESDALAARERALLIDQNVALQTELDSISSDQRDERLVDDCLTLYLSDIEIAKGVAQVTLGDNLAEAIIVFVDKSLRDELAQEVFAADADLRNALMALDEYLAIDPPPEECPHPNAQ